MFRLLLFLIFISNVYSDDDKNVRVVELEEGAVYGEKYWNGDYYRFFGVPYATAPTGRDRYKAPLPVQKRDTILDANKQYIMCQQSFYTEDDDEEEIFLNGQEDCLVTNIFVPVIANKKNLLPVIVYIHSGAFAGGSANMGSMDYIARRDVIAISFNYRVGALGFACLGTEDIPGNAALKDQLAALKWIKKNVVKFGGNPNKITLAGFSVGATMAELHAISKHTDGLFDKLILESGSALTPFAINRDPVSTAKNIAASIGYNGTGDIKELNEFYLEAPIKDLAIQSVNFFLPNSTFGFAPCIENTENNPQPFLTESPLDTLRRGDFKKISILTGFANMEGLSRAIKFREWYELMNKNFADFLPADLVFDDANKEEEVTKIKDYYFKGKEISHTSKQEYVDYFSDSMFKYPIIKSLKLHADRKENTIYFYEFSYVGGLNMKHHFMGTLNGASHRDQSAYIWDFLTYTNSLRDMDTRDRMTYMWTDFVKYGNPTAYESSLIKVKWLKYSNENQYYLSIGNQLEMKKGLINDSYHFWNNIYDKYYWNPTPVKKV